MFLFFSLGMNKPPEYQWWEIYIIKTPRHYNFKTVDELSPKEYSIRFRKEWIKQMAERHKIMLEIEGRK